VRSFIFLAILSITLVGNIYAAEEKHSAPAELNHCIGAGPQSPRDIDNPAGSNSVVFETAPDISSMNLCNIHFHRNAEHKYTQYSTFIKVGSH